LDIMRQGPGLWQGFCRENRDPEHGVRVRAGTG